MLLCGDAGAQINVAGGQTASVLAQKLAGQGVTVLNAVLRCPSQANGLFTVVSSNLGLDSGIVLTTGRAESVLGSYGVNGPSDALASSQNGTPGDSMLNVLSGQYTKDACGLDFDVVPAGDTVSIDYVFSSEEYISAVCGPYNDVFAFFISGPGITGLDNMAKVPGTTIPVAINSINNGIPGASGSLAGCTSMGPGSPFTAYYNDNISGTSITHKGMTKVLKAMHVVSPCDTYHFRIVIADAGNDKYDSGVFLEAGSLKTGEYKVQALATAVFDGLSPICIKGCLPGHFKVKNAKAKATPQVVRFATTGSAVSGVDYIPLADSVVIPAYATYADVPVYGIPTASNGAKTLGITIYAPSICNSTSFAADSAVLTIYDTIYITTRPADTIVCGNDSVQLQVIGDGIYSYSWVPLTDLSGGNTMIPLAFPMVSTVYTVTATLPGTSCPFRTATVNIITRSTAAVTLVADTQVCYNTSFQLSPVVAPVNSFYSYQWNGPGGYTSSVENPVLSAGVPANAGIYHLTVTNDTNGCKGRADINVAIFTPPAPVVTSPAYYCLNNPAIALNAYGNELHWYLPDGTMVSGAPAPPVDAIAQYLYHVTNVVNNCESPQADVQVKVEKCCDGNVFIPSAFSPNADGLNDIFRVQEDFSYSLKTMSVFNRWGQVVYSGNVGAWDGTTDNGPADAGVYYYKITFGCILGGTMVKTGDVTLIR
ncbi:hypothetical protein CJD36_005980 [Flavipsychrobacter stenotrophus]|uniref:Ig-like domain-containing protein n=2 Tax=Flavipsychrobacter stenotrophus TaxID=2077091 RepID=A0A2S7SXA8_9BACT|nr:hypothetical protein CJD36_005980 [Flavipsychrobacter stenotrophus]